MPRIWQRAGRSKHTNFRRLQVESLDARRVMASAYQNPGQIFDVNNDTYVDREDLRLSEVRLSNVGEGALPAARNHPLVPFYDVNGDGAFTRADLSALRAAVQSGRPTVSFKLASDSGNPLDRVTNNAEISGRVMRFDGQTRVFASIDTGIYRNQVEITGLINRDGTFRLTIHDLHRISGKILPDGRHTLTVQAYDRLGRTAGAVDSTFTLDRTGPRAFELDGGVFETKGGIHPSAWIVRWKQYDGRTYDLNITTDAEGKNSVFYRRDVSARESSRYAIMGLEAGTYYVWVTGFDESGNRTRAIGDGQRVHWAPATQIPIGTVPTTPPPTTSPNPVGGDLRLNVDYKSGMVVGFNIYHTWHVVWNPHSLPTSDTLNIRVSRNSQGTDIAWQGSALISKGSVDLSQLEKGTYYVFVERVSAGGATQSLVSGKEVAWQVNQQPQPVVISPSLSLNVKNISALVVGFNVRNVWNVTWNRQSQPTSDTLNIRVARDAQGTDIAWQGTAGISQGYVDLSFLNGGSYFVFVDRVSDGLVQSLVRGEQVHWRTSLPTVPVVIETPLNLNVANFYISGTGSGHHRTWNVTWDANGKPSNESLTIRVARDAQGSDIAWMGAVNITEGYLNLSQLSAGTYYVFVERVSPSGTVSLVSAQEVAWLGIRPNLPVESGPLNLKVDEINGMTTGNSSYTWWRVTWNHQSQPNDDSLRIRVARDAQGADLAYETVSKVYDGSADLSHLDGGMYYVFVDRISVSGVESLISGQRVQWPVYVLRDPPSPTKPGEFRITTPEGFVQGTTLNLQWEASEHAVRYEIFVRPTHRPLDVVTGWWLGPGASEYDWHKYNHRQFTKFESTTNQIEITGLEEGRYIVDIVAYNADGDSTVAKNFPRYFLDANGVISAGIPQARATDEGDMIVSAPLSALGPNGIARREFEFFSSADLNEESLIGVHTSETESVSVPLASLANFENVYVRTTYIDRQGVRFTEFKILQISLADLLSPNRSLFYLTYANYDPKDYSYGDAPLASFP
jgi:uncharacterized protein (DUF2141 family)